ncbi:MAG TPA: ECF transporter S component, partial [Bacillota bacterium]|nr:ECF transporter S component [Bacillota bacterium]
LSSWVSWAPFTLIIVGLMGYISGLILEKRQRPRDYILAVIVALLIKVFGYYLAEWFIFGNLITPLASIPGNVIQVVTGGVIAYPVALALKKVMKNL